MRYLNTLKITEESTMKTDIVIISKGKGGLKYIKPLTILKYISV